MDGSKIEWTDATWNPLRGCSRVSEGCRNCYAERIAARFSKQWGGEAVATMTPQGPRWTGQVNLVEDRLDQPLRWKRARRIFVNSMSDLFHEKVPDKWIMRIWGAMIEANWHTYQILTKRPERMRDFFERWYAGGIAQRSGNHTRHIWLGVSVEDQATADERIPPLLQTPAAVRFVSYEPALKSVNFCNCAPCGATVMKQTCALHGVHRLSWIICGGESGPGARPFDLAWARSVVAQAKETRVPVFIKQLGARPLSGFSAIAHTPCWLTLKSKKGGGPSEWPEDLRVREFPR